MPKPNSARTQTVTNRPTLPLTLLMLAVFVGACLMALSARAEVKPQVVSTGVEKPASVIFIGNSFFYFNNGIVSNVGPMVLAGDPMHRLRQSMVTISGSGANWHDVESYFRPNAIGSYSFDAQNNIIFNDPKQKLFDIAVMMDCSQCPVHPELKGLFRDYMKKHSDTVRKHGTVPVFFMSWAYQDKPEMTQQLADAYTAAGNDNKAMVIPAGLAFARSVAARPDINLYVADKRHPSVAGTYLASATTYAALFRKSPVGFSFTAGLEPATAKHLQEVALATVEAYFGPTAIAAR